LNFKHTDVTNLIIKAFYTVYNTLGYGFLEKVYQNALAIELRKLGVDVIQAFDNPRKGSSRWLERSA
jgi:GxxExxY protein